MKRNLQLLLSLDDIRSIAAALSASLVPPSTARAQPSNDAVERVDRDVYPGRACCQIGHAPLNRTQLEFDRSGARLMGPALSKACRKRRQRNDIGHQQDAGNKTVSVHVLTVCCCGSNSYHWGGIVLRLPWGQAR